MASTSNATELETVPLPQELQTLTALLDDNILAFAVGDKAIEDAALISSKCLFDLAIKSESRSQQYIAQLLESMGPGYAPQTRSQAKAAAASKVTQAEPSTSDAILKPTPLTSLFIPNMGEDQIWAQLDLKASNMCESLVDLFGPDVPEEIDVPEGADESEDEEDDSEDSLEGLEGIDAMEVDSEGGLDEDGSEEDESEEDFEDEDGLDPDDEMAEGVGETEKEHGKDDSDGTDDVEQSDASAGSSTGTKKHGRPIERRRHTELDDDFFNLAEFNAETEEAESQRVSRGRLSKDGDDDDDDDDEDDEVDLFTRVDDPEAFEEDDLEESHADLYYKDFFKPPRNAGRLGKAIDPSHSRASSKVRFNDEVRVKKIKGVGRGLQMSSPSAREDDDDVDFGEEGFEIGDDNDMDGPFRMENFDDDDDGGSEEDEQADDRETIERLKDDLFAEDDELQSDLTTFQRRQAQLKEQIVQLEAENVAKKDWTLMGEVASRARPQNSLLEEDLEFERVMKVVPIVTEENVQDLESRIKGRILANNFDDVIRRKPVDDKPFLSSRLFELQDSKSSQSLAQVYEDEFVAAQSGGVAGEDRDGKLKKEHDELEKQWESICYKLDALCNAHFTPKQPKAAITTVTNVSAITLESALPTAKSSSAVLAAEEVFAVKSTDLRSRSELTPAEKQALRMKEKKRRKKQRQLIDNSVDKFAKINGIKGVKKQKEAAMKSIVKSGKGVTVIGKKSQETKKHKGSKQS